MSESILALLFDALRAPRQGVEAIKRRQRARLAEMVSFARANSPYYRELYQNLPQRISDDPTMLPVTSKKQLMPYFDDWVTDRKVTVEKVRTFVENTGLIGERFQAKYTVATTSGTTGTPGMFLMDDRSMAVTSALAFRMLSAWLRGSDIFRIISGGGRLAMVNAMGGHFASAIAAARLRQRSAHRVQVFPVSMPPPEMAEELNRFRPTILSAYASMGALLAAEQEAGRLNINPVLVVLSAEGLPLGEYDRIASAFNANVRYSYAATECPFISYSCEHGWLHVNSDWLVLEPVDTDYQPVPPGQQSHTALISNLANRLQPILRYDIGDSILQRPDPCSCGNPLPAIRVQGRTADVLTFKTTRGEPITIAPLVLGTIVNHIPGIALFQIVQPAPTSLRVRLRYAAGADPEIVWQTVHAAIARLLTERKLPHVEVERAEERPEQSPGGKYREIIPLK